MIAGVDSSLAGIMKRAFAPREKMDVVRWCEKYIEDIPGGSIRGRFSAQNSPVIAEIMRAIANPRVRKVVVSACVQSGKTLAAKLALSYFIANSPGPAMWLDITDDSAKDQSETSVQPMLECCAPVKALFPLNQDKKRNRSIIFENGMVLWFAGQKNISNLQRRSIRYIFGDETWLWERSRMKEAEARTTAFHERAKIVFMSQGSFAGDDTANAFESGDQREWCFTCPHCGKVQPFTWENVQWDAKHTEEGAFDLEETLKTVHYKCTNCEKQMPPEDRPALNASAKFIPQNPNPMPGTVSFHWNAIATEDWRKLVATYLEAKKHAKRGDRKALMEFFQKQLALPWGKNTADDEDFELVSDKGGLGYVFGEKWEKEAVFDERVRKWITAAEITDGDAERTFPRLRFMTIDVQESHFYYVVRAWSKTGDSRLVDRGMTMDANLLEEARIKNNVRKNLVFIDAHYKPQMVNTLCVKNGWTALIGDRRKEFIHKINGKNIARPYSKKHIITGNIPGKTAQKFIFSNLYVKNTLADLRNGKTEMLWQIPNDIDLAYLKQINAETFDQQKQEWTCRDGKDNHFFDCETMQVCAALMSKIIGRDSASSSSESQ